MNNNNFQNNQSNNFQNINYQVNQTNNMYNNQQQQINYQQVNNSNYQPNNYIYNNFQQNNNSIQNTPIKKNNNNKVIIIVIAIVMIIAVTTIITISQVNKKSNNIQNIPNNNDTDNSQTIIYNDFKYNEVLNNFGIFDNKYVFNNTYDNITIDGYNPNSKSNAIELTVNYNNKNFKLWISAYTSYDDFMQNIDKSESTKYLIDTENEIFSIKEQDNNIIIANYGYKLENMIIEFKFYNDYSGKRKINTTTDELKAVIDMCKNTISLNDNNRLNPEDQLKDFYIFNNYKLKNTNNIKNITENSISLSYNNNNTTYYIDIYFDINEYGYEFSNLLDDPKRIEEIDGFTINWTDYENKALISMEKNNQKLYFLISTSASPNKAPTLEESYDIFKLTFSN